MNFKIYFTFALIIINCFQLICTQEDIEEDKTVADVECGASYDMEKERYIQFHLNQKEECEVGFYGSRFDSCTSEIFCTEVMTPPSDEVACEEGFLQIEDGFGGKYSNCDTFYLNSPKIASNGGKDLYIKFKGTAEESICQVYCGEERHSYQHLKTLIPEELHVEESPKYDLDCECGVKTLRAQIRVVGGMDADPFEFSWMAVFVPSNSYVEKNPDFSNRVSWCGASIITDRHILTAGHCFFFDKDEKLVPEDWQILLHAHILDQKMSDFPPNITEEAKEHLMREIPGWNETKKTDADENSIRADIESFIPHPLYEEETLDWDIGIIVLKDKLDLTKKDYIRPICLQPPGLYMNYKRGQKIELSGWGLPHEEAIMAARTLQKVTLPIVEWQICKAHSPRVTKRHICAGPEKGGQDACQGDSGSAISYKMTEKQYIQAGIVSGGDGCARVRSPGCYTNMNDVIQWIYHTTKIGSFCKSRIRGTA